MKQVSRSEFSVVVSCGGIQLSNLAKIFLVAARCRGIKFRAGEIQASIHAGQERKNGVEQKVLRRFLWTLLDSNQ
jgi:hypothetical protein